MLWLQVALHGYVSKAAAVSAALFHVGENVGTAAKMGDIIMDPADSVCVCAFWFEGCNWKKVAKMPFILIWQGWCHRGAHQSWEALQI